jgi:hypothetical protein
LSPTLEIGFTSVSFSMPSGSEFKPLSGTTVQRRTTHGSGPVGLLGAGLTGVGVPDLAGSGWAKVATVDGAKLGSQVWRLLDGSTSVTGAFGTGQLLQTPVLNALSLPNGTLLVGFVTPSFLEAVAASSSH